MCPACVLMCLTQHLCVLISCPARGCADVSCLAHVYADVVNTPWAMYDNSAYYFIPTKIPLTRCPYYPLQLATQIKCSFLKSRCGGWVVDSASRNEAGVHNSHRYKNTIYDWFKYQPVCMVGMNVHPVYIVYHVNHLFTHLQSMSSKSMFLSLQETVKDSNII